MKRTKIIALLLGAMGVGLAPTASFAFTTPTTTTTASVPKLSDWYSWFYWTFTNASPQTITNVYVAHQTVKGADNNDYTIASIAPGQTVGPFWGDWHFSYEDDWVLRYNDPLLGNAQVIMAGTSGIYLEPWLSCGVESNDLNQGYVTFTLNKNPTTSRFGTPIEGTATISPPVTTSCVGAINRVPS